MLTLGNVRTPAARSARDRMLFASPDDKWLQVAALSASSDDAPRLFQKAVHTAGAESAGKVTLFRYTSAVIGARQHSSEMEELLTKVAAAKADDAWWRTSSLDGLTQGLRSRQGSLSSKGKSLLLGLFERAEAPVRRAALQTLQLTGLPSGATANAAIQRAGKLASDDQAKSGVAG